ncbi:hypothetical protein F383_25177 [Gossypium arboreum]|uniref:Uncharacterized protein n=1 Tax=Gossypium arboreum TaxID=29729 RepID=A0A0B0MQC9_GOSAR|nr:hypothetical protein F383_25177 [Gossypium arboreum]
MPWLRKRLIRGDTGMYRTYSSTTSRKFNEIVFNHV